MAKYQKIGKFLSLKHDEDYSTHDEKISCHMVKNIIKYDEKYDQHDEKSSCKHDENNFGVNVVSEVLKRRVIVADRVKGAFISSISHELRTVLYGIILDFAKLESEKQDYVEDPINQKKLNEKENDNKIVNKNNKKKKEQKERIDLVKLLLYRIFLEN
ncbi:hypothetical protein GLOIN_2v1882691 [Rhizophagus irregularis DAOM 181602=DAOM 197198]|uniref:Signal transduction histidine kinase dimerisation/phosphoacceptor domain-containing protein n=1 Tax=Rhizophagus irregularis (strain DAOM 181602 / DAOM 197198 / MUCL 43194) TaxID=747089 RepID=A0A2P4PBH4_RHIID|nr:hypothetical protein GLOIN_2v1882691 [Rhizophagus irregularis DAOM 181602=DAOM 197198]POG62715.1 hypothetical protein GLOIN_2v1882691 [Rhizophagus irregularis DAOM 181602=DAOM 197198]|eukprot:XP_025169581.1 hypothetical protein GLOIN_2v1882691 [Rhizophagus irregularis DAOM 181602=DAOM 197198]